MKISVFQFDITWLDPQKNISEIENHLKSIDQDTDLLVLPEMFLTGFCMNPELSSIEEGGDIISSLVVLSKEYEIGLIGSLAIKDGVKHFNRVLLITEEGIVARYDKQYLYSPSGENEVFSSKYDTNIFEYKGWKILPQICYDLRFPENVRSLPAPDILIYMANWPKPRISHWNALLQARAIENLCFVIGCNREGKDGNDWEYPGNSQVVHPDGTIKEFIDQEFSKTVTVSLSTIEDWRSKYRFLEDKKMNLNKTR